MWGYMLSSGMRVLSSGTDLLSSGGRCYHLGRECYHLGGRCYHLGGECYHLGRVMLSSRSENLIILSSDGFISCYHLLLSSEMITPPFFINIDNVTLAIVLDERIGTQG